MKTINKKINLIIFQKATWERDETLKLYEKRHVLLLLTERHEKLRQKNIYFYFLLMMS